MSGFDSNEGSFASFYLILITEPLFPSPSFGNKKDKTPEINFYLSLSCVRCICKLKSKLSMLLKHLQ